MGATISEERVDGRDVVTGLRINPTAPTLPTFTFESVHLSCASDVYKGKEHSYAGFLLYAQDGKTDWRMNGRHCKSGYIVIQDTSRPDVKRQPSKVGIVHGKVYMNVFGQDPTKETTGEGFSVQDGKIVWNSYSFNAATDGYHDGSKVASPLIQRYVKHVVEAWMMAGETGQGLGCRNFPVRDLYEWVNAGDTD